MKKNSSFFSIPYVLWLLLFVIAPVIMILWQSFLTFKVILLLIIIKPFLVHGLTFA